MIFLSKVNQHQCRCGVFEQFDEFLTGEKKSSKVPIRVQVVILTTLNIYFTLINMPILFILSISVHSIDFIYSMVLSIIFCVLTLFIQFILQLAYDKFHPFYSILSNFSYLTMFAYFVHFVDFIDIVCFLSNLFYS